MPVLARLSQATRLVGSSCRSASRTASEIWSHILSGCPSDTDSEVNTKFCNGMGELLGLRCNFAHGRTCARRAHDHYRLLQCILMVKAYPDRFTRRTPSVSGPH